MSAKPKEMSKYQKHGSHLSQPIFIILVLLHPFNGLFPGQPG